MVPSILIPKVHLHSCLSASSSPQTLLSYCRYGGISIHGNILRVNKDPSPKIPRLVEACLPLTCLYDIIRPHKPRATSMVRKVRPNPTLRPLRILSAETSVRMEDSSLRYKSKTLKITIGLHHGAQA